MNNVAVGQHQAIRADDEAGAAAAGLAAVAAFAGLLARLDLHDRRTDALRRMDYCLRISVEEIVIRRRFGHHDALAFQVGSFMGQRLEGRHF